MAIVITDRDGVPVFKGSIQNLTFHTPVKSFKLKGFYPHIMLFVEISKRHMNFPKPFSS